MSKKGSSYENIYTEQISNALFDQTGYESKKEIEKKKNLEKNEAVKRQVRGLMGLGVVAFLGAASYFISLDPANAGPAGIAFGVFLVLAFLIWLMNR
jgi:FtsH-binding integral membrane protein